MAAREFEVPIERVFEVLLGAAADDVPLRLHIENAQRQVLAEVQLVRIEALESELRVRLEADAVERDQDAELAAVPDDPADDDAEDPTG